MSVDLIIVVAAMGAFIVFLGIFFTALRFTQALHLIKMIKQVFLATAAGLLITLLGLPLTVSWAVRLVVVVLAAILFAMLAIAFILCVFGPNETSIRIKLLSVIGDAKEGISRQGIAQQYHGRGMLNVRLKRLLGAGDIKSTAGGYVLVNKGNAFFVIDGLAKLLKKLYRIKE